MNKTGRKQRISEENQTRQAKIFALVSFPFGLLLPVLSWILDIFARDYSFTVKDLWLLHLKNPSHFLIDLFPFILAFSVYLFTRNNSSKISRLQKKITEKNRIIEKNANFAKKIGEGDFSTDIGQIDREDLLGNSLLIMRDNLVSTYQKETEQNWITKGKEVIGDILRQHNNISVLAYETIISLINYINAAQGTFFIFDEDKNKLVNIASYAYNRKKYLNQEFRIGQGLVGQAAYEKDIIYRKEIPDEYITISSGILGYKKPRTILLSPLINDEKLQGVIEFASLEDDIPEQTQRLIKEVSEIIAQTLFNLKINTKTEQLLKASQEMTEELQKNEEELRRNADYMKRTQIELEDTNRKLAAQIQEVERSQKRLHTLLVNASEVISIYDENGMVKYVSPSVVSILGFNPEDIINKNGFERGGTLAVQKIKEEFKLLLENSSTPRTFEYQYEKNEHEIIWLETTGRNLIKNAAIEGIIFNTRDITVRKIAEKAQRLSGEMQALSENSPDMIMRIGPDGKVFYANPIFEKFTGLEIKGIIQKSIDEIDLNQMISQFLNDTLLRVKNEGTKFEIETKFPTIEEEKIVQFNAIPEYNRENELETILFVAHDVTERKRIELEIEEKNKNITESINYAQRIQSAIIPDFKKMLEILPKSFVFYQPRDVVSGDMPWYFAKGDDVFIAAVDCTGHGVPGALLSFIAYFTLNSIVDHDVNYNAGQILDLLHFGVRKTLKQDKEDADARDGMDIAFCKINYKTGELHFSGAHRPLYYVNFEGKFEQYKGNMQAIGGIPSRKGKEKEFQNFLINFKPGEKIFFFSDGLPDQIGGEAGRKYQANRIRDIIMEHLNFSMQEYYDMFVKDFNDWKGDNKQIDDILLVGIEF